MIRVDWAPMFGPWPPMPPALRSLPAFDLRRELCILEAHTALYGGEAMATQDTIRAAGLDDLAQLLSNQQTRKLDVVAPATCLTARNGDLVLNGTQPIIGDDGVTQADGAYR